MKRHIHHITRRLPNQAISVVEMDGMFQKIGRAVGTLTSIYRFWQLITQPPWALGMLRSVYDFWQHVDKE